MALPAYHGKRHPLSDILTITVCAVLAGASTWPDIETCGRQRLDWLQRFLELPNGIPRLLELLEVRGAFSSNS